MPNPFRKKTHSSKGTMSNNNDTNSRFVASTQNQQHHGDFPEVGTNGVLRSRCPEEKQTKVLGNGPIPIHRDVDPALIVESLRVASQRTTYRPGRRASIERRTRQDPYHASLIDDRVILPSICDDPETPESQPIVVIPSCEPPSTTEPLESTDTSCPEPPEWNDLIIGRQDPNSRYFTRRHALIPDGGFLQSVRDTAPFCGLHWCSDVDPAAYELYEIWTRRGTLPSRYRDVKFGADEVNPAFAWAACWPLMNAAIMGYSMKEVEFTDQVMDALNEKVPRYIWPDRHTLRHLFEEQTANIPHVLKNFVVDRCVECGPDVLKNLERESQPGVFTSHLDDAIQHLKRQSLDRICEYHTHATPESCYKRKMTRKSVWRNDRYKRRREFSRIDTEQVATDSRANNVHTVDWAECGGVLSDSPRTPKTRSSLTQSGVKQNIQVS